MKRVFSLARVSALLLIGATAACSASPDEPAAKQNDELTSLTARARKLEFAGYVYVDEGSSDTVITLTVKQQTQSAFGALQAASVGVNTRELSNVDPTTFQKIPVDVVDVNNPETAPRKMWKVAYTYTDDAIVPTTLADRSTLPLALLGTNYQSQSAKILPECTNNDALAAEFQNSIWYVFNPQAKTCAPAMAAEQQRIDTDRATGATDATSGMPVPLAENQIPYSELNRLYIPMTVKLTPVHQDNTIKYPEYDMLYSGFGVESGKLVIGMVNGLMGDWAVGQVFDTYQDPGYPMWFGGMREIFNARPGFELVSIEGLDNPLDFDVFGEPIHFNKFEDVIAFELDGKNPAGMGGLARNEVRKAIAKQLALRWVTFEAPVEVTVNGETRPLTIKLQTIFGTDLDPAPHKKGLKTSDVFVYNGHSYIGYGPLDPSRLTADDFPGSYQILNMNGCVSYNYYEKDYWPLKLGGTKGLDIITNGLESWVTESGQAMGRFVGGLIDGQWSSYPDLLVKSQFTYYGYEWGMDALRVVDGELDNTYTPAEKPITVAAPGTTPPQPPPPATNTPPAKNDDATH